MSLYARSDLMSVSIPSTFGGCGETHTRPVMKGAPAKVWKLDCSPCESHLRGDGKPKVIKVIPGDKDQGIPSRMEHVIDAHPQWSNTPEGVPPTPDEQHVNKIRSERGDQELRWLEALIAAKGANISIPDSAMWRLEQTFGTQVVGSIVNGTILCANHHDNAAGVKFCTECGVPMTSKGAKAIEAAPEEAEEAAEEPYIDIFKLSHRELQKMCKEKGVSARGAADELRQRLNT